MYFQDKMSLAKYGAEFQNSFIVFKLLDKNQTLKNARELAAAAKELDTTSTDVEATISQSEQVVNLMYKHVADCWISGSIFDSEDGKERPMKKEDIESFPPKIIQELNSFIQGNVEKKG